MQYEVCAQYICSLYEMRYGRPYVCRYVVSHLMLYPCERQEFFGTDHCPASRTEGGGGGGGGGGRSDVVNNANSG